MTKSHNAKFAARVDAVYRLLLAGATRQEMLDFSEKQGWNVTPRQVDTYIRKARALLEKDSEFLRTLEFGKAKS
ncbi:MAG: hypothetical protein K8I82_08505, partial [Anaerolineae bacterium]|nr:hypothetical protein [Anaerolineae bacterium]